MRTNHSVRIATTVSITVQVLLLWTGIVKIVSAAPARSVENPPKLVVGIIIDQFRYDYLTRFRSDYHGGLDQLMTRGADFTNAFYGQVPTVTAVGHSIFMSGAMPAVSGIVGNDWYDREAGKIVTSVCDWDVRTVGAPEAQKGAKCTDADPASPKRLLVTTVGDELRVAHRDSKVIGISLKARAAILPSGHRANAAFWFDDVSGNFVSSSYYVDELPSWAIAFNQEKLPAKYVDRQWENFPSWNFHEPSGSKMPYGKLPASPWGNELVEKFAEQAIVGEKLGQHQSTDLLTISFSSNDYVGHASGPDSPEVRDMSIRTDQLLAKLFQLIDQKVGLNKVVIVLSADHGVAPTAASDKLEKMPGGVIEGKSEEIVQKALDARFGHRDWLVAGAGETSLYFNEQALYETKGSDGQAVSPEQIYLFAKGALFAAPGLHVARIYSRAQLDNGIAGDFIAQAEMNGYFPRRSGDLNLVFEPGFIPSSHGTTHFSPYAYDRHVPVLFMGPGITPGRYNEGIQPNDIAPTLATMLNTQTPSGSSGRVLEEMLTH